LDLNNLDDTTIQQIHQHLNVINNLTKFTHNLNENQLEINKEEAGKKFIRPQLRFSSTYRKKKLENARMKYLQKRRY
jgi:hypothetical protein